MGSREARPAILRRSPGPAASTLDLVGDKWSLLIIRDMLHGKSTFSELMASPEGIPTNILADRLRRLEEAEVISRAAYQEHPVRFAYALTSKGKELGDVVLALVRWGTKNIPGTRMLKSTLLPIRKATRH
jgi:DNA-binding HxlR family transcriptional regulator